MPTAVLLNPDDEIFDFVHAMTHRQYFAVMKPLYGFSALPYNLDPAIDTDSPGSWWNQNHQQAHDDFNRSLPGYSSNGYSIRTVTPPTVTGNAALNATTSITLSGTSGTFLVGTSSITGTGIPAGTTIVSQTSGTPGGNGVYVMSQAATVTNPVVPVTITHPPYQQATAIGGFAFGINQNSVLLEGESDADQRALWAFWNHTEHMVADNAILPLPTTAPTTAGTGPGTVTGVSDPWWWAAIGGEIIYPFW